MNPYAPPETANPKIQEWKRPTFREGWFLAVPRFVRLPDVCVMTNQEMGEKPFRLRKEFIHLKHLRLTAKEPYLIDFAINEEIYKSREQRAAWFRLLRIGMWILFIANFIVLHSIVYFLVFLLTVNFVANLSNAAAKPFKVKKYDDGYFYLAGFHPDFLNRFPERHELV